MKKSIYLVALVFAACSAEQESYTQTLTHGGGISTSTIEYYTNAENEKYTNPVISIKLAQETNEINYPKVEDELYTIRVTSDFGTNTFAEIPAKFINLDANVSFSRQVFESIFPEEWEPMKGTDYSTIYIQSKNDKQVFYTQVVSTGTNEQIAQYSEDF